MQAPDRPERGTGNGRALTVAIGLLVIVAVVAAQLTGRMGLERLESLTLDARVEHAHIFAERISDDIVHVDIDDEALRQLGKWPWRRTLMADLVDTLAAAGSRVIAMDLLAEDPEEGRWERRADGSFVRLSNDVDLASAIERAGSVVIAIDMPPAMGNGGDRGPRRVSLEALEALEALPLKAPAWDGPVLGLAGRVPAPARPIFMRAAERVGAVHVSSVRSELSLHEVPAWQSAALETGGVAVPHLGIAAAAAYLGVRAGDMRPDAARLELGAMRAQLRGGMMSVPWSVRSPSDRSESWLTELPARSPAWLRVHRHISCSQIIQLGERRRTLRDTVSFLLATPLDRQPTSAELATADEEASFLLQPYEGQDVNAVLARLDQSSTLESMREAATLELLLRYRTLRELSARGGADEELMAELRDMLEGKLVFVGWIATGVVADFHRTPLGPRTPGVVVHAAVASGVLTGRSLMRAPLWVDVGATVLLGLMGTLVALALTPARAWMAAAAIVVGYALFNMFVLYDAGHVLVAMAGPLVAATGCWMACATHRAVRLRTEKAAIRRQFSARVPTPLVDYLAEHPEMTNLEGEERDLTVVFTDFTGFAAASESMDGRSTVALLNQYLRALTDVLIAHGGYVNKFLGDGVMCFWGAPVPAADHASLACRAIVEAVETIGRLNAERERTGQVSMALRVGISTGRVVVGDCGAPPRLNDYTVIGDSVNLAARLESANKQLGTRTLLTRRTVDEMGDALRRELLLRPLGLVRVMGQSKGAEVWELVGRRGAAGTDGEIERWIEQTAEAVRLFRAGDYAASIELWRDLVLFDRGQAGALLYVQRCHELIEGKFIDEVLPLRGK